MNYFVYILANRKNGTLYIGVTNNLRRRTNEHAGKQNASFTQRYNVGRLVYFEEFDDIRDAIVREKRMKKWRRSWKIQLIETFNPDWKDYFLDVV